MKLIIAGGRNILSINEQFIHCLVNNFHLKPTLIIEGGAKGVDAWAKAYAICQGIPYHTERPDYATYCDRPKYAPIARNGVMARMGEALLLIWDGQSSGSNDMRKQAIARKLPVYECILRNPK